MREMLGEKIGVFYSHAPYYALPTTALSSFDNTKALPLATPEEPSSVAPYESEVIEIESAAPGVTLGT